MRISFLNFIFIILTFFFILFITLFCIIYYLFHFPSQSQKLTI